MKKVGLIVLTLLMACGCNEKVNSTTSSSNKITSSDVTAPIIYNVKDKNFELGTKINMNTLLSGVYSVDDVDGKSNDISLTIYNFYTKEKLSNINIDMHGKYILSYQAVDSSGNVGSKEAIMRFGKPEVYLNQNGVYKTCFGTNYSYDYDAIQKDYKLVFEDNFDSNYSNEMALNPEYWIYEKGGSGWGNGELQAYTSSMDNCFVQGGNLVIRAKKEQSGVRDYTSARVHTINEATWCYGKIEVRASLPKGAGSWPAIWMMPSESVYGVWPASGEIDIMENSYGLHYGRILGTTHTTSAHGNGRGGSTYIGDSIYTSFHTYSIEWLPDQITWYVDGNSFFTYKASNYGSCPNETLWPFDQKFFLILNLAIGGAMGGSVDDSIFTNEDVSMYVDYVKVYQSDIVNSLNPSF